VLGRAATALLSAASLLTLTTPSTATARPGWGKPFRLTSPYATDLTPVNLAMSPRGDAAAAFSVQDEDHPAASDPFIAIRAARGGVSSPFPVPGAQLVLDLAYDSSGLRLLTGTSESGKACCSTVQTLSLLRNGKFGRASTLVTKLAGATAGSLTTVPSGRLLATIATDRGVWAAQSRPGGGFGPTRRLTAAAAMPWTVAATADAHGRTTVAWTATTGQPGETAPGEIVAATGSEQSAPGRARTAFRAGGGRQIDELGLAPSRSGATAAWTETWFDRGGTYHAQVVVSDLAARGRPRALPAAGGAASGLVLTGDEQGDQLVAWKSCSRSGACTAYAAVRPAGGRFGSPQRLGAIDPGQSPAAAVAPGGDALVGWIASGHVYAAERRPGAGRLGSARTVSNTSYASGLAFAFGPTRTALASWTQGTLAPDVVGAVFRG
jgi:hypothetical protein